MISLNKKSLAFILYDWATSPITTIHATFIFSVYFIEKIAIENGPFVWGCIIAAASLLTALLGPILGSFSVFKNYDFSRTPLSAWFWAAF